MDDLQNASDSLAKTHSTIPTKARTLSCKVDTMNSFLNASPSIDPSKLLLDFDEKQFQVQFNRSPFMIEHNLVTHSLFNLERLIELSQFLPETSVEYNSGEVPVSQDPNLTPRNGLSITETIRRIEECRSWLVLKNVEKDPEYRDILYDCLDQIRTIVDPIAPGMRVRQGFIFISSAGSVTPFHIDPENNFLLQIRGNKHVQLFDVEVAL
jgi:hypothetical protein